MRRRRIGFLGKSVLAMFVSLLLVVGGSGVAAAQDQTGGGFDTLNITADAEGYHLVESVTAGWYVVSLTNATEEDVVADIVMLPEGRDAEELQQSLNTENGGSTIPDWFEEVVFGGGPSAPPLSEAQTLVELTPGTWTVLEVGQVGGKTAEIVVTEAEEPVTPPGLAGDVEVIFEPGALKMPSPIPVGEQVWSIANTDTLTHAFALVLLPDEISYDEMLTLLTTGTAPEGVDMAKSLIVGGIGLLSGGRTIWTLYNLNPGYYVALDYVPLKDGRTFAEIGQFAMFTVR